MKVAMISDWYPPKLGGVETIVQEVSRVMNDKPGVDVEVITQDFDKTLSFSDKCEVEDGVKVRRLAGITGPLWGTYFHPELPFKVKDLIKREDYDVVHTHHFFTLLSVVSTLVAKQMYPNRKCVVATNHTYHAKSDSFLFKVPKLFASYAGRSADRVFVGSNAAAKLARETSDPDKIRILKYGVPIDGYSPEKESPEIRDRLGVDSGLLILYVGRFGPRKGVEYLLRAYKMAFDELENPKLVLIGKGPKEKNYRKFIRENNLEDHVVIEGFKPKEDVQRFYATCDFAIFPSVRDESFGRVLPEAMASGKPYIATDIPGFDEVHESSAGILVPPANPEALAEKIVSLSSDEKLRQELGKNGRGVAEEKYDWENIVDRMLEIYQNVISGI